MNSSLSRIRIEASGDTPVSVEMALRESVAAYMKFGNWEEEEPGLEIQTTAKGFWGRLTIRRKNG